MTYLITILIIFILLAIWVWRVNARQKPVEDRRIDGYELRSYR